MKDDVIDTVRAQGRRASGHGPKLAIRRHLDYYMIGLSIEPIGYIQGNEITPEGTESNRTAGCRHGRFGAVNARPAAFFLQRRQIAPGRRVENQRANRQFAQTNTGET
jgi:hypothetical protein